MPSVMPMPLKLADEDWNQAVELAPGFWVIATHHHPGTSKHMPDLNNRCLIFRLNDASNGNQPVLLVANSVDAIALPEVRRIANETGLPIAYLIAAGSGHSLNLVEWHDSLPEVKVLVGPARIPRIAAGKKLAKSPRFVVFDQADPLPMFHGQLEALNFDGICGGYENVSPKEGAKDTRRAIYADIFKGLMAKDPYDELWLYHDASRTIIGGENLGWNLSKVDLGGMNLMFKLMLKAEQLYVMTGARPVIDKAKVQNNWRHVLNWPAINVLSYHDTIGTGCSSNGQAQLAAAVAKTKQYRG